MAAEATAVGAPDQKRHLELLAGRSRRRVARKRTPGEDLPGPDRDLHAPVVGRGPPEPVGASMPVDRLVTMDAQRVLDPPARRNRRERRSCSGCRGESRGECNCYGCAIPQGETSCTGTRRESLSVGDSSRTPLAAAWGSAVRPRPGFRGLRSVEVAQSRQHRGRHAGRTRPDDWMKSRFSRVFSNGPWPWGDWVSQSPFQNAVWCRSDTLGAPRLCPQDDAECVQHASKGNCQAASCSFCNEL